MAETVQEFFDHIPEKFNADKAAGMSATYQFVITGDAGGEWYVAIQDGKAEVHQGVAENPNITLTAKDSDWLQIVNGKMSGQTAFLLGKLKIKGDMGLAMKLQSVFQLK